MVARAGTRTHIHTLVASTRGKDRTQTGRHREHRPKLKNALSNTPPIDSDFAMKLVALSLTTCHDRRHVYLYASWRMVHAERSRLKMARPKRHQRHHPWLH